MSVHRHPRHGHPGEPRIPAVRPLCDQSPLIPTLRHRHPRGHGQHRPARRGGNTSRLWRSPRSASSSWSWRCCSSAGCGGCWSTWRWPDSHWCSCRGCGAVVGSARRVGCSVGVEVPVGVGGRHLAAMLVGVQAGVACRACSAVAAVRPVAPQAAASRPGVACSAGFVAAATAPATELRPVARRGQAYSAASQAAAVRPGGEPVDQDRHHPVPGLADSYPVLAAGPARRAPPVAPSAAGRRVPACPGPAQRQVGGAARSPGYATRRRTSIAPSRCRRPRRPSRRPAPPRTPRRPASRRPEVDPPRPHPHRRPWQVACQQVDQGWTRPHHPHRYQFRHQPEPRGGHRP